jgi:hypothetical protein
LGMTYVINLSEENKKIQGEIRYLVPPLSVP